MNEGASKRKALKDCKMSYWLTPDYRDALRVVKASEQSIVVLMLGTYDAVTAQSEKVRHDRT
jgi:hypothetical protein